MCMQSADLSALKEAFFELPKPSSRVDDVVSNVFALNCCNFFASASGRKLSPVLHDFLKDWASKQGEGNVTFFGRAYKIYCAMHSVVVRADPQEGVDAAIVTKVVKNAEEKIQLVSQYPTSGPPASGGSETDERAVPKVVFGKTGLQMSVITNGSMRYQQTWGQNVVEEAMVEKACQANLKATILRALDLGVNHFETARGYGSSEIQMGIAFKEIFEEGLYKREDVLIQTKVRRREANE